MGIKKRRIWCPVRIRWKSSKKVYTKKVIRLRTFVHSRYLLHFTCRVVSHGPGRASQETSWSGTSSAPSSLLQLLLCRPAHLDVLSCLYFRWKFSLLTVSLMSLGMSFQLLTTLLLKKFLLISSRPCLTFRLRGTERWKVHNSYSFMLITFFVGIFLQPSDSTSASNSAFFDNHIKIIWKNYFLGHILAFIANFEAERAH